MWNQLSNQFKRADEEFLVSENYLAESYQRCQNAGMKYELTVAQDILRGEALHSFLEKHRDLAYKAKDLFSRTLQRLHDQKTLFILTDGIGRAITVFSSPEVLVSAAIHGIVAGSSLREDSLGTNAVSLALHHAEKISIRGNQHFCRIFADWHCIAVPLMGTSGKPIACLDISTYCEETLGEKIALANVLAGELQALCQTEQAIHNDIIQIPTPIQPLTARQQEVLILFSQGLSYQEIAQRLQIQSPKTVEKHLDVVRVKLSAKTRRECIQQALKHGLL